MGYKYKGEFVSQTSPRVEAIEFTAVMGPNEIATPLKGEYTHHKHVKEWKIVCRSKQGHFRITKQDGPHVEWEGLVTPPETEHYGSSALRVLLYATIGYTGTIKSNIYHQRCRRGSILESTAGRRKCKVCF